MPVLLQSDTKRSLIFRMLLILALGGCDQAAAPPDAWRSIPLDSGAGFNAVFFTDAQNGWLAGGSHLTEGGLLGTTTDGGVSWAFAGRVANDKAKHLTSIHFFNSQIGIAGTDNGEIVRTSDGGRSWETTLKVSERFGNRVSHFSSLSPRVAYAVIRNHVVRTRDRGATWQCPAGAARSCPAPPECPEDENADLNASAIALMSPARIAVINDKAAIAISEDGGCTWQKNASLTGQDRVRLNDLFFVDANHGWVVGDNGFIAKTSDGGRQWRVQTAAVAAHFTAVHFVDPASGFLIGRRTNRQGSVVLATSNGGENWELQQTIENDLLEDLFVDESGTAWAAGGVLDVTKGQRLFRRQGAADATAQLP